MVVEWSHVIYIEITRDPRDRQRQIILMRTVSRGIISIKIMCIRYILTWTADDNKCAICSLPKKNSVYIFAHIRQAVVG